MGQNEEGSTEDMEKCKEVGDQVVEHKDDRSLIARMLIVARSRPEMNLK